MKDNEMSGLGIAVSSSFVSASLDTGFSYGQGSEKKGWYKMKKLMFTAALCAAGAAMAVESQVVGYTDKPADQIEFIGAIFPKVGGVETMTYADFKPNCDETGEVGDGWQALGDGIIILNPENGNFVRKLVYLPSYMAAGLSEGFERTVVAGWYDENEVGEDPATCFLTCYNSESLTFGTALQVNVPGGSGFGAKVTWAGEVKTGPTATDVDQIMAVANCSAKKVYLKDVIVNCDETGEVGNGWQALGDGIIILNPENGNFVRKLVYLPGYMAAGLSEGFERTVVAGWYDENEVGEDPATCFLTCYNEDEGCALPPGGGVQVNVPGGAGFGAKVTIKSALAVE